jgi:hypothetical protein
MPAVKPFFVLLVACVLGGLYILLAMPVILAVLTQKYRKNHQWTTDLLVAIVMLLVFYISAALTWFFITPGWDLTFLQTLQAAFSNGPYARFAHIGERLVIILLMFSTIASVAAGIITAGVRYFVQRKPLTA